jgi:glutamate racemase
MLGIFDSGIGGLTVVREILRRAPQTSFVYLGDTARAPYGNKSAETIGRYAVEDVAFLLAQGATDIVVACNTASSLALEALRQAYPQTRFFDVITPAVAALHELPQLKKIGVIGTRATIRSGTYEKRLKESLNNSSVQIFSVACPLFVPLVEENWLKRPETKRIARAYLQPLRQHQIDALVLGCTHYPLLEPVIRTSLQKRVQIIDSPSALVSQLEKEAPELLAVGHELRQEYFFTDTSPLTDQIAGRWLGRIIKSRHGELAG